MNKKILLRGASVSSVLFGFLFTCSLSRAGSFGFQWSTFIWPIEVVGDSPIVMVPIIFWCALICFGRWKSSIAKLGLRVV